MKENLHRFSFVSSIISNFCCLKIKGWKEEMWMEKLNGKSSELHTLLQAQNQEEAVL